ncbi:hypothetical protein KS4_27500 [Poriferisphaera corsica]|uniref:Uncharacterized protein n=1 Tax=Poriferisphaera corsica TaxID=2528020 RepID=A0A517YWT3_9BACT|nr:hypothetical protein KS4_27500 [Poriferisphaera corsica]
MSRIQHLILMGISGCCKTEIGNQLASYIRYLFVEGEQITLRVILKRYAWPANSDCRSYPWPHCLNESLLTYESTNTPIILT